MECVGGRERYNTTMHYRFQSLEMEAQDHLHRWLKVASSLESLSAHVEQRGGAWLELGGNLVDGVPLNETMVPVLNQYVAQLTTVEQFLRELSEGLREVPEVPGKGAIHAGNILQGLESMLGRFWLETSWRPHVSGRRSAYAREAVRHGLETPHLRPKVAQLMEESSVFWEHAMLEILRKGLDDEHAEMLKHGVEQCSHQPGEAFVFYCVGPVMGGYLVVHFVKKHWPEWFQRLREADATVENLYGILSWTEQAEAVATLMATGTDVPNGVLEIGHLNL